MYYIAFWSLFELNQVMQTTPVEVLQGYRGYELEAFPADLRAAPISVNLLASCFCPTGRNVYVEKILQLPRPQGEVWARIRGRELHTFLQEIHRNTIQYAIEYTRCHPNTLRDFDVYTATLDFAEEHITATRERLTQNGHQEREINRLILFMRQIATFEAIAASSILNFRISRANVGVRNLAQEIDTLLDFRGLEQQLQPRWLGLSEPITIDFLYRRRVIGDIKTGEIDPVPGGLFELTCAAYALAWERQTQDNIDWGVILHLRQSQRRNVPICQSSELYPIDTQARIRLINRLEQRLRLIRDAQDPGYPENRDVCRECPYEQMCYPNQQQD